MKRRICGRRMAVVLLILCLLFCGLTLPAAAVTQQVAVVACKEVYMDGEQLQIQARLVPPQSGVTWSWECRMPGEAEASVVCTADKIVLDLTAAYHGAVLCPVATLTDGTVVRGPEKTLVVELYCTGLEIGKLPVKSAYAPGEIFDPTGLQILARMSDGSSRDVTDRCSYMPLILNPETTAVRATCELRRENGGMGLFYCDVPVTVAVPDSDQGKDPGIGENPDGEASSGGGGESNQTGDNAGSGAGDDDIVIIPGGENTNPGGSTGDANQKPDDKPSGEENSGGTTDPDKPVDGNPDEPAGDGGDSAEPDQNGTDGTQDENASTENPGEDIREEGPVWSKNRGSGAAIGICLFGLCAAGSVVLWRQLRRRR